MTQSTSGLRVWPSYALDSALTWTGPADDSAGAHVPEVRSRHALLFLPTDAEAPNAWIWCATAPGRAAEVGEVSARGQSVRVELRPGVSTLTCAPNELVRPLHDRMPVILRHDDYRTWLEAEDPRELLVPCPEDMLECFPVSSRVNSPKNDAPDLIAPAR